MLANPTRGQLSTVCAVTSPSYKKKIYTHERLVSWYEKIHDRVIEVVLFCGDDLRSNQSNTFILHSSSS